MATLCFLVCYNSWSTSSSVFRTSRHDAAGRRKHISPLLQSFHWLRCRLLIVLHFGWRYPLHSAQYLLDNCSKSPMFTDISDFVLRLPLLWFLRGPVEPPLVVEVSLLRRPQSRTACQKQFVLQHL